MLHWLVFVLALVTSLLGTEALVTHGSHGELRAADHASPKPLQTMDGDRCLEAEGMSNFLVETWQRKQTVLKVYQDIFATCASGVNNLDCVIRAQYADRPAEWLELCNQRLHGQPAMSTPVCSLALKVRDDEELLVHRYGTLSRIVMAKKEICRNLPLPCIVQATQCLDRPDIPYCFEECIRAGNMDHALVPDVTAPPLTTIATTSVATTVAAAAATTSTAWWQSIVDAVEETLDVEVDGNE